MELVEYEELYDFEDDFNFEDEADELALSAYLGGTIGAGLGGGASSYLYDGASHLLKKYGNSRGRRLGSWLDDSPNFKNAIVSAGSGFGGLAGAALGGVSPSPEADAEEPEYESFAIDEMEALMEIALEGDGEDAQEAIDSMVARVFGPMRAAAKIRQVIAALRPKIRNIVARARQDPRFRNAARIAPLALRRTAVKLLRMFSQGQPIDANIAARIFSGVMADILESPRTRRVAAKRSKLRAHKRLGFHRRSSHSRRRAR